MAPAEDDLANFRDVMELISTRVMHLLICSRLSLSLSPVDYSYSYRGRVLRNTGCIVGL